ncbi:unnamed protein product, partial [Medioppia subpectinata]
EIIEGVEYLHKNKILHRNLRPSNILLKQGGINWVKIGDFGMAKMQLYPDQSNTQSAGDKDYRAPEVHVGSKYTTQADVYSIGLILVELFHININKYDTYSELKGIIGQMLSGVSGQRPTCSDILNQIRAPPIVYDKDQVQADTNGLAQLDKNDYLKAYYTHKINA